MNNYTYNFEVEDLLKLFVSAFDDAFIYRHDADKNRKSKIGVRYIFGPKQRVLHDIVNAEKHITLPAVTIDQQNIQIDRSRILNKDQYTYRPNLGVDGEIYDLSRIPTPVPVTIDLEVGIVAKYKSDIDQIISNFLPYCNPYFVITWNTPKEFSEVYRDAINIRAHWSGDASYDTPSTLTKQDKYRITATTSFKLEGWIFPADERTSDTIYSVHTDFTNVPQITQFDRIDTQDALDDVNSWGGETETISVSAHPSHTNTFYKTDSTSYDVMNRDLTLDFNNKNYTFLSYGKRYDFENSWVLSGDNITTTYPLTALDTIDHGTVDGYLIDAEHIDTINDNIAIISIPAEAITSGNNFTIVTKNDVGYAPFEYSFSVE